MSAPPKDDAARHGWILQPTYRVRRSRPIVQLFGRLEDGAAFLVEDDRFRPYFFVGAGDTAPLAGLPQAELRPTPLRGLEGGALVEVRVDVPGSVPALREKVEAAGGRSYEADLRFPYRFLTDHGLHTGVSIRGEAKELPGGLLHFVNPELRPAAVRPGLHTLSIDLETTPDASRIYSAALVGAGADEVHLVSRKPVRGARVWDTERELLAGVAARIAELDPDLLVGWNVVDFDLRVWERRRRALRADAELGRVPGAILFQQDPGFTRQWRATLPGRMVLDGLVLVRDAVRLDDYRLETAAQALLGRGKAIDADAEDKGREITRLYHEDPEALVAYNREDARLVLDILEREGLLDLTLERSLLSGMQLDRVGASIASFDLLYLPELRRRGRVAPSVDRERKTAAVTGGALLDPQPGLFRDVAVFDFQSLYPSLIRTFHLDPLAHALAGEDAIEAPNGARFSRDDAILPELIERFRERRERARERGDRHAVQAIKIMMNAMFGVLGAASCRFFDPAIANAITRFGQQTLAWTREAFEDRGVRVIYGDTDSVFVALEGSADPHGRAAALRDDVEQAIHARVRARYRVEPRLVLELERVYERFFLPRVRGGREGSKKRYAGLCEGRLELVGLEAVRSDWPAVAGRLQRGMLERLFRDEPVLPFVRDVVGQLRAGALDRELVYARRVRKGGLERYTATTPPHVQAARKAGGRAGLVVRYLITDSGPEPVLPGHPLPERIDHAHYLDKVLRPVAESILQPLELDFAEATGEARQLSLL